MLVRRNPKLKTVNSKCSELTFLQYRWLTQEIIDSWAVGLPAGPAIVGAANDTRGRKMSVQIRSILKKKFQN